MAVASDHGAENDRKARILDATLELLAERGIAGVSARSVARRADVALGLVTYHFTDMHNLVSAALRRIGEMDLALVQPGSGSTPERRLQVALGHVVAPEFLETAYLTQRMQLWSLAGVHADFAAINIDAHERYRSALADLIHAARPHLTKAECRRRAVDVDVLQNGMWLSVLLGSDRASIRRAVARTEEIALAP